MSDFDRRTFLKAAGAGIAVSAAAGEAAAEHENTQFKKIRNQVVDPYAKNPEQATKDGFVIGGPYVPDMGWHFLNQENVNRALVRGFDITEPQVLVYVDEEHAPNSFSSDLFDNETGLGLGAVEYAIPNGAWGYTEDNPPNLFDDEHAPETSEADGWHVHGAAEHALMTDDGTSTSFSPDDDNETYWSERLDLGNWLELVPGGTPGNPDLGPGEEVVGHLAGGELLDSKVVVSSSAHPDLLTLHVWLGNGFDNPEGVFQPHNDAVAPDHTDHNH